MMGKTHITVGIASAVLLTQPTTLGGCLVAIIGGSTGGIICDIEVHSNRYCRDALYARYMVAGLVAAALLADSVIRGPATDYFRHSNPTVVLMGAGLLAGVSFFGRLQKHRTFTHSLLALVLLTIGVGMLCLPLAPPFAIGFVSHVALDLMNKKPVQLLYPSKAGNVCLRWCYADGIANKVFLALGTLGIAFALGYALVLAS